MLLLLIMMGFGLSFSLARSFRVFGLVRFGEVVGVVRVGWLVGW